MKIAVILTVAVVTVAPSPSTLAGPQDKPLGDVAREQRQLKRKAARHKYTNEDLATITATRSRQAESSELELPAPNAVPDPKKGETESARTALDQPYKSPPDNKDEMLVVPAGTQIRVEFTQPVGVLDVIRGRVTVPVRVGWTTAIPAGSKAKMDRNVSVVELVGITVRGRKYKVKTNTMPIFTSAPGSDCEIGFVLEESIELPR